MKSFLTYPVCLLADICSTDDTRFNFHEWLDKIGEAKCWNMIEEVPAAKGGVE